MFFHVCAKYEGAEEARSQTVELDLKGFICFPKHSKNS